MQLVKVHGLGRAYYIKNNNEPNQKFSIRRTLRGKVVDGQGNFSFWIGKLSSYYEDKTGMRLFPGTLNIQLDETYDLPNNVVMHLILESIQDQLLR
jgi:CTP-dependent riboflavin kinase